MKVFISWSGDKSHKVALAIRDWLPSVIQSLEPYVSSEDIDKGTRWSTDISKELEASEYGILCVTKDNLNAPWLNFEAGALSKAFDKSKVSPFLFDVKRSEVQGPLLQFQSTIFIKSDVLKLIQSLNKALDKEALQDDRILKGFNVWWPGLEKKLKEIDSEIPSTMVKENKTEETSLNSSSAAILEEILELVRNQQKLLNSPESLLPPPYIHSLIKDKTEDTGNPILETFFHSAWQELYIIFDHLVTIVESIDDTKEITDDKWEIMLNIINNIREVMTHIERKFFYRQIKRKKIPAKL